MNERADIDYELVIDDAGACVLTCGGEVIWTSDADDDFAEAFPDMLIEYDDEEQIADVLDWLVSAGYVPPGVDVDVVEDDSSQTGQYETLEDESDENI